MSSSNMTSGDDFINILFTPEDDGSNPINEAQKKNKDFYNQWVDKTSARHSDPLISCAEALLSLYPNHSLVTTQGYGINLLGFPAVQVTPLEKTPLITNLLFVPFARSLGTVPGVLVDQVNFGAFQLTWKDYEYIVYLIEYPQGLSLAKQYFVLYEGPQEVSRLLLLAAGAWADQLHEEIWVYNQGFWSKDHALWKEIQKADWKDVILNDVFKKALQKDVYGFFTSKAIYERLGIPWKRGLIMYGPPGNGKTISLKIIMKTCGDQGFYPLYVKSFKGWKGEEASMADVFDKARQLAPCVLVLEDLDSLINDENRSFFLNQLDGLQSNDGLFIIGTTNHFDRLDPGLSSRPSRFDRKYKFDDPDMEERKLYVLYWQTKLLSNKEIDFPDYLVDEVARLTDRFSFACLKETFVSSLIIFASIEIDKPKFANVLKDQIDILQKQLDKSLNILSHHGEYRSGPHMGPSRPPTSNQRDIRTLLDALSDCTTSIGIDAVRPRIYESGREISGTESGSNRDIRALLDAVSDSLASLDLPSLRAYEPAPSHRGHSLEDSGNEDGKNFRTLLDRMTTQKNINILGDRFYPPPLPPKEYNPSTWGPGNRHPGAPTPSSSQPITLPTLKDRNTKPNAGVIYE